MPAYRGLLKKPFWIAKSVSRNLRLKKTDEEKRSNSIQSYIAEINHQFRIIGILPIHIGKENIMEAIVRKEQREIGLLLHPIVAHGKFLAHIKITVCSHQETEGQQRSQQADQHTGKNGSDTGLAPDTVNAVEEQHGAEEHRNNGNIIAMGKKTAKREQRHGRHDQELVAYFSAIPVPEHK